MTTESAEESSAVALQHEMAVTRDQLVHDLHELHERLSPVAFVRAHPRWILGLSILLAGLSALGLSLVLRRR